MMLTFVLLFGASTCHASDPHNLSDYGWRTVNTGGRGALVFQTEPGGSFLSDHQFYDGDQIYVNLSWREKGYSLAYDNGTYGFVDASYINWGTGTSTPIYNPPSYSYDPHNLSDFVYRTVNTGGRGALVFQTQPAGSFLSDHQFYDGDSIYVNQYFRENGYALAYENGTYGFVDASYINWNNNPVPVNPGPVNPGGAYDLSNYGYRTVNTGGRGALVFQTQPAGSFLSAYQYYDGDSIYVNLYYRESGYTMAYSNGVYGYVDASYINW